MTLFFQSIKIDIFYFFHSKILTELTYRKVEKEKPTIKNKHYRVKTKKALNTTKYHFIEIYIL